MPSHLAVTMLDAFRLTVHLQSPWSQKSAEPFAQVVTSLWSDSSQGFLAEGLNKVPLPEMGSDVVLFPNKSGHGDTHFKGAGTR